MSKKNTLGNASQICQLIRFYFQTQRTASALTKQGPTHVQAFRDGSLLLASAGSQV